MKGVKNGMMITMMKMKMFNNLKYCPTKLYFAECPICGSCQPFHYVRVIRLLSSVKKGKYIVWCKNKHKFEKLYKDG